jgi:5-formyltetrahydrofolate cyclo-ligase
MVAPHISPDPRTTGDDRERKALLRAQLRARRASLPATDRTARSVAAAERLLGFLRQAPFGPAAGPIAAFRSLADEIDTQPLLEALCRDGHMVLLPRQVGRGQPLALHAWAGEPLRLGPFGVEEPGPEAPVLRPALVLVPLLGFDRRGGRLGYGAGYYDRTLSELAATGSRPPAIGFAFDLQEVDEVPMTERDVFLDRVVTESRVVTCGGRPLGPEA